MKMIEMLNNLFRPPKITRTRIVLAMAVAVATDLIQLPLEVFPFVSGVIDVVAGILTVCLLGFHLLLLPTFVIELFPIVDIAPTWTGCVMAVIFLRRRDESAKSSITPPPPLPSVETKSLPQFSGDPSSQVRATSKSIPPATQEQQAAQQQQ